MLDNAANGRGSQQIIPDTSGVGGGIVAVVPGVGTVVVWSPGLNSNGNSLIGAAALEMLAQRANWSVFD